MRKSWRAEVDEDAKSAKSDESLGEQLPSEAEEEEAAAPDAGERLPSPAQEATDDVRNPVVWMRLRVGERLLCPFYVEVFQDLYPRAAEGFCALCSGEIGAKGEQLGYAGTRFHRIVAGQLAQGGDLHDDAREFIFKDASAPASASGALTHSRAGLLSFATRGPDAYGPSFSFTLAAAAYLDGRSTVFGQTLGTFTEASSEANVEARALHPLRHLEAAGSPGGGPREEIVVDSCGVCGEADGPALELFGVLAQKGESEQQRYARARFSYAPLRDIVSEENAEDVLALASKEVEVFESHAKVFEGEAQTSIEAGTASMVHHRCEQLEVSMTRIAQLLDEVDFRSLGETRAAGKRVQQRVRALAARISQSKAWAEEGETEAYEQRR